MSLSIIWGKLSKEFICQLSYFMLISRGDLHTKSTYVYAHTYIYRSYIKTSNIADLYLSVDGMLISSTIDTIDKLFLNMWTCGYVCMSGILVKVLSKSYKCLPSTAEAQPSPPTSQPWVNEFWCCPAVVAGLHFKTWKTKYAHHLIFGYYCSYVYLTATTTTKTKIITSFWLHLHTHT